MIILKDLVEKHPRLLELPIDIFETMYDPENYDEVESLISNRVKPTQEQLSAVKEAILNKIKEGDIICSTCECKIIFSYKDKLVIDDRWNRDVYEPSEGEALEYFAYYALGDWYDEYDFTISDIKEMLKYFDTALEIKY